jgi:hypothetical protein
MNASDRQIRIIFNKAGQSKIVRLNFMLDVKPALRNPE